jgi:hypothetical protein
MLNVRATPHKYGSASGLLMMITELALQSKASEMIHGATFVASFRIAL